MSDFDGLFAQDAGAALLDKVIRRLISDVQDCELAAERNTTLLRDMAAARLVCRTMRAAVTRQADVLSKIGENFMKKGLPTGDIVAVPYLRLSGTLGSAKARGRLGLMLMCGLGCAKDERAGIIQYSLAAEQGDQFALNCLAEIVRRLNMTEYY